MVHVSSSAVAIATSSTKAATRARLRLYSADVSLVQCWDGKLHSPKKHRLMKVGRLWNFIIDPDIS